MTFHRGYYVSTNGIASTEQAFTETIRGAGNALSSVSDYAKWISAILNKQPPISEKSYATLLGGHSIISSNPIEPFGSPLLYGLGWISRSYKGEMIVFHDGAQFGYGASVILLPGRKFGLVILGNNMNGITAAQDILAYHLIDEELGISFDDRFDWVTRYIYKPFNNLLSCNRRTLLQGQYTITNAPRNIQRRRKYK